MTFEDVFNKIKEDTNKNYHKKEIMYKCSAHNTEYPMSITIHSTDKKTNQLNITAEQFLKIYEILGE